ncbi:MAG: ABC transporter substrate-binding protein [Bacilli bacterium]|nr:ABC transporter substrate-binding protein [Bacilli bacterium]
MKKSFISLLAVSALIVAGCGGKQSTSTSTAPVITEKVSQGVTDTEILVGNTATVGGAWAIVGAPFNAGIKAYFEDVNEAGGIDGRTITLTNRDDGFDGAVGLANTEKLVETDKVFALVGHFGTPTVSATLEYIKEVGVPMVYAATGVNALYTQAEVGSPVMPVQPIYYTEGRLLLSRVLAETDLFGSVKKVGVLYSDANDGTSIKAGIEYQASQLGLTSSQIVYAVGNVSTGDYSTPVQSLKAAGCDAIIIAANQAPFLAIYTEMNTQNLNVPVITSYVNADATAVPASSYNAARPIYVNAWVDIFSAKGQAGAGEFATSISNASFLSDAEKAAYAVNSYAIAGYIAAHVFTTGVKAVAAKDGNEGVLNWKNYIAAMEGYGNIDIPMGGTVNFAEGHRWGIDSMAVLNYTPATEAAIATFGQVKPLEDIATVVAKIK